MSHYLEEELRGLIGSDPQILRFIESASLDGLWYWDLEQPEHEWMSDALWTTLGIDPASRPHRPEAWQELAHPEDVAQIMADLQHHCEDADHPFEQLVRFRHADGSTVWVRCRGMAVRDEAGKARRMLGSHTDITALKRAEQLALANARELEQFLMTASHDLRSPVVSIRGLAKYLREDIAAGRMDEAVEAIDRIDAAADRMQGMISDLLEYGRVGRAAHSTTACSIDEVIGNILEQYAPELQVLGIVVDHAPTNLEVHADPRDLHALIDNLVANAIRHGSDAEAPTIVLRSEAREDGMVDLLVGDSGPGVPEAQRERIFSIFERGAAATSGTGVGLSIVRRIAELGGGKARYDDTVADGAGFRITLPKAA